MSVCARYLLISNYPMVKCTQLNPATTDCDQESGSVEMRTGGKGPSKDKNFHFFRQLSAATFAGDNNAGCGRSYYVIVCVIVINKFRHKCVGVASYLYI